MALPVKRRSLAEQFREIFARGSLDVRQMAQQSSLSVAGVQALLSDSGTWHTATALMRGLNRAGMSGTIRIHAVISRKDMTEDIARRSGLDVSTVLRMKSFVSTFAIPVGEDVRIANLEAFLSAIHAGQIYIQ